MSDLKKLNSLLRTTLLKTPLTLIRSIAKFGAKTVKEKLSISKKFACWTT